MLLLVHKIARSPVKDAQHEKRRGGGSEDPDKHRDIITGAALSPESAGRVQRAQRACAPGKCRTRRTNLK